LWSRTGLLAYLYKFAHRGESAAAGGEFGESAGAVVGTDGGDGVGHQGDGLAGREQTRDRATHAIVGGDPVDYIAIGCERVEQGREVRIGEDIQRLLLDDDLTCADQCFGGLQLTGSAGDAVRRPLAELGIVFAVGVGSGDQRDTLRGGEMV